MRHATMIAICLCACVPPAFVGRSGSVDEPYAQRPMSDLRSPDGACVSRIIPYKEGYGMHVAVRACAHTGSVNTVYDDAKARLSFAFDGETFQDANPSSWYLTLVDPVGSEVFHQVQLTGQIPDVGSCSEINCRKNGFDVIEMPDPWIPGTYHLALLLGFDTTMRASMDLALEGPVGTPSASSVNPATKR